MSDLNSVFPVDGKRYYTSFWFGYDEGGDGDILAALWREEGSKSYSFAYRTRVADTDEKFVHEYDCGEDPEEICRKFVNGVFKKIVPFEVQEIHVNSADPGAILDVLGQQDFAELKVICGQNGGDA